MSEEESKIQVVGSIHPTLAEMRQQQFAKDALERMVAERPSALTGDRHNQSICCTIDLPRHIASQFPDPEVHAHGHTPHLTICFVKSNASMADASLALQVVRQACKRVRPFRMFVDTAAGLHDFGPNDTGEKALWFDARSDPRGELGRLHRIVKQDLEREGMDPECHPTFRPHVTWCYVDNDISEKEFNRINVLASSKFPHGIWMDVRFLMMMMPNGRAKAIPLSQMI